jgi:hypothetical protein
MAGRGVQQYVTVCISAAGHTQRPGALRDNPEGSRFLSAPKAPGPLLDEVQEEAAPLHARTGERCVCALYRNTTLHHYKDHLVNAVLGNNRCLF